MTARDSTGLAGAAWRLAGPERWHRPGSRHRGPMWMALVVGIALTAAGIALPNAVLIAAGLVVVGIAAGR